MDTLLALAAGLLVSAPSAPSPFTGCEAVAKRAGIEYECPGGVSASAIEARASPEEVAKVVDDLVRGLIARDHLTRTTSSRVLNGETVEVVELTGEHRTLTFAKVRFLEGTRIVSCGAPNPATTCVRVLSILAGEPWGAGVEAGAKGAERPILIAGQPLVVPEHCRARNLQEGGDIRCEPWMSGGSWTVFADEKSAEVSLRRRRESCRDWAGVKLPIKVREDDVPCQLAARKMVCHRQVATVDIGQAPPGAVVPDASGLPPPVVCVTASVPVEGGVLAVECFSDGNSGVGVPCTSMFGVAAAGR